MYVCMYVCMYAVILVPVCWEQGFAEPLSCLRKYCMHSKSWELHIMAAFNTDHTETYRRCKTFGNRVYLCIKRPYTVYIVRSPHGHWPGYAPSHLFGAYWFEAQTNKPDAQDPTSHAWPCTRADIQQVHAWLSKKHRKTSTLCATPHQIFKKLCVTLYALLGTRTRICHAPWSLYLLSTS